MSEPPDERLALSVEEAVLLWCTRVWVVGQRRPVGTERRIRDMLARLDAPDAAPHLEAFMFALSHEAARRVAVNRTRCPRVSEDERALLDVFGLAQEARSFEALLLLRRLATLGGARAALRSAEGVGLALARAGHYLLAPEAEMRRLALAAESVEAFRHVGALH